MRDLQILILDLQGNQLGELDLTDSDDFALKLTKSIASINDLGRRNTSFSLDFEAPQTKNNNKLLAGLRFVSATKEILGQKPCSILVDGNQIDRGFLYPYESKVDGMYTLVFKGLNNDWVEQLRDVELNELEWRDYKPPFARSVDATELFDVSRINILNTQNSTTADLTYPFVNRNNSSQTADLRPQLHLRSIFLAMFHKIGYTISSNWLDSDWVKAGTTGIAYTDTYTNPYTHFGLAIDPSFQLTRDQQDLLAHSIDYSVNNITGSDPNTWADGTMLGNVGTNPTSPTLRQFFRFPTLISTVVTDNFSRFDPSTSEYTVGVGGTYALTFNFENEIAYYNDYATEWIKYTFQGFASGQLPPSFTWIVVKNNVSNTSIDGTPLYSTTLNFGISSYPNITPPPLLYHVFATGDKISVFLKLENDSTGFAPSNPELDGDLNYWRVRMTNNSRLTIAPIADIKLGDVFRINTHIPDGIKCLSLLQDFKTMFNLYFDVDVNRKVVFIEPRDDYFSGVTEDITDKIDLSTPPVLNYLTSYKNEIVFKYATDSKDKYLEQWNKINDKTYAEYKYVLQNNERFEKGQSTFKTNLISATIQGELESANIISSVVKEEYLNAANVGKPVNQNYGMRVFQLVRGTQYDTAGNVRLPSGTTIVSTAIMENYANTPTFEDRKLTFVGTRGLVEDYYAKTLANIEDTAVLTVKINLSLYDFISWDLSKTYYIDSPAEIKGYYITDKIANFNVTKEQLTTITLVKFKDFTPVTVQQGVGNVNVITQNTPQPTPILCEVNGVIVDCLDNNFQQMFKL